MPVLRAVFFDVLGPARLGDLALPMEDVRCRADSAVLDRLVAFAPRAAWRIG
ncbi:hypothetical protein SALBM135S_07073 [Streptomyces alboniger]